MTVVVTSRAKIQTAIREERDYQDKLNDFEQSIGEEILMLNEYVARANRTWTDEFTRPEIETLAVVRKIAAIALRCLEHHGCPTRSGI